uniref:WH1 domain-containing protein n=1 Tax=Plectus sambesii TaxID=2011161 RepID=A0A914W830_9BILA
MASSGRKREKPPNKGSELLDSAENHSFFNMLGKNCVSLASGVTQLLAAEPPNLRQWTKKCTGVVALVKDYSNRAYYLRLYDLQHGQLWEQKLYINFRVYDATAELLTFEGDDCVFGLNFCSREEARNFKYHIDKRNETEQKASLCLVSTTVVMDGFSIFTNIRGLIKPFLVPARLFHTIRGEERGGGGDLLGSRTERARSRANTRNNRELRVAPAFQRLLEYSSRLVQAATGYIYGTRFSPGAAVDDSLSCFSVKRWPSVHSEEWGVEVATGKSLGSLEADLLPFLSFHSIPPQLGSMFLVVSRDPSDRSYRFTTYGFREKWSQRPALPTISRSPSLFSDSPTWRRRFYGESSTSWPSPPQTR